MRDVAQVMSVSVMTVSNAFNRPDQLSPELRTRILNRAEKMGYAGPNAAARALRHGHSNAYGIVFADSLVHAFSDPFTIEWLAGIAEAVAGERSSLVLMSVPADDSAGVAAVANTSVDGIAAACETHPIMDAARARGLPVVAGDPGGDAWVSIDERAAGRAVADHLVTLGHRDVWVLLGATFEDDDLSVCTAAEFVASFAGSHPQGEDWLRLAGVLEGLSRTHATVLRARGWDRAAATEAASKALDRAIRPTAILALSDTLALGLLDAMEARGLRPGHDLSVTGFDDIPEATERGLTTVRQPIREKGRVTAELLLNPTKTPRQVTLRHALVPRSSTGPAPTSGERRSTR